MPVIAAVVTGLLIFGLAGWYFGLHVPGPMSAREKLRLSAALEKLPGPEEGQRWTIPSLSLAMMPIAPGIFSMGTDAGGYDEERPVTQVRITKPYWLGATEVTQSQWQTIMGSNRSNFKGDNLPVEQVSWTEAMEYCRKLTERERSAGRLPEGYVYTLPTEAQWEYACRAGTTGDYAGNLDSMGWYNTNSGNTTHEVGAKQPNSWGLYDMHGNVQEWCLDWYANKLPGGNVHDPEGPSLGSHRVRRGGCWWIPANGCRSTFRTGVGPDFRNDDLGFRLALAPTR